MAVYWNTPLVSTKGVFLYNILLIKSVNIFFNHYLTEPIAGYSKLYKNT